MNYGQLVAAVRQKFRYGYVRPEDAVCAAFDVIKEELQRKGSVTISGFGTFSVVQRAPRIGRNPHTGEAVPIAERSMPSFKPAKGLIDNIQNPVSKTKKVVKK